MQVKVSCARLKRTFALYISHHIHILRGGRDFCRVVGNTHQNNLTLTVKGFKNLLNAGRSVSADRYMQGSIRVMPGCFITGQAVGVAASLACENANDIRNFPITELQEKLKNIGVFLPKC